MKKTYPSLLLIIALLFSTIIKAQDPLELEEHWAQPNGLVNAIVKDSVNNIV